MDRHLRSALLGRLCRRVDLKIANGHRISCKSVEFTKSQPFLWPRCGQTVANGLGPSEKAAEKLISTWQPLKIGQMQPIRAQLAFNPQPIRARLVFHRPSDHSMCCSAELKFPEIIINNIISTIIIIIIINSISQTSCVYWYMTVNKMTQQNPSRRRGVVVASLVSINEVNLRWAWLVLGWVTVSGFDSRRRHFISVCNQLPRSTKGSHGVICR